MSCDKFICSYTWHSLYIYTLYRDVNYSVVAISKRTRSNLTKRIRTRLSIARKLALYHCVTFSKTGENFVTQTRMNHRFIFKMLYIYIILKKKKKRILLSISSPTEFPNFQNFREYPSIFVIENYFPLFLRNDPISRIH